MTIRVRIEHNGETLEKQFDDTVALIAFLDIAGYYIGRSGLDAMFKRFSKSETIVSVPGRRKVEPVG